MSGLSYEDKMIIEMGRRITFEGVISVTGAEGSVTPAVFKYPYAGTQTFTVSLGGAYQATNSIHIVIDGITTEYYSASHTFTLTNATALTAVAITFPAKSVKNITLSSYLTVTPSYFTYPSAVSQSFSVALKTAYLNKYGITIEINGAATTYYENTKTFSLATTSNATTVTVTAPARPSTGISVSGFIAVSPTRFIYPYAGDQIFNISSTATYPYQYYMSIALDGTTSIYNIENGLKRSRSRIQLLIRQLRLQV
jgi:hypothetical protein